MDVILMVLTTILTRESAYRAGFDHKYPHAYPTYEKKVTHFNQTRDIQKFAPNRAQKHEEKANAVRIRELHNKSKGRRR
jgi:hypothetical protein